ncbi:hypothetical protein QR680_018927 [Steinernema hermaphroditum]|uniref:Secreted protein n=1 Tax=Steinernema hermaphroditum TaxID=289476 RepID=A0AA39HKE9_9BILA|nr:hypothetical protein QR680_018927 [Steinernema hermaphroditum]
MLSIALFLLFTLATAVPSPNVTTVDPSRRLFFVGVGGEVLRTGKNKDRCITMMVGSRYPNNRSPEPFDFPVAAHCRHDVLKAKLRCEFFQFSSLSRYARFMWLKRVGENPLQFSTLSGCKKIDRFVCLTEPLVFRETVSCVQIQDYTL